MLRLLLSFLLIPTVYAQQEDAKVLVSYSLPAFESVMKEIREDIQYSIDEVAQNRELWQDEYKEFGSNGNKQLQFSDLTIHQELKNPLTDDRTIIVSTNGAHVWGDWNYTKPHIYVIQEIDSKWAITNKMEVPSTHSIIRRECKHKDEFRLCGQRSFQFFLPQDYGDSYQPYVFQQLLPGASASSWKFYIIEFNRFSDKFDIHIKQLGFPIIPNTP